MAGIAMTETGNLVQQKQREVFRFAQETYENAPDWITFFREILGLGGIVRRAFPTRELLAAFEQTETYTQIQQMLTKLREKGVPPPDTEEPTRVITVRLPKSLHEALRVEAHEHHTSMNKLCISKLLRFIDNGMVPTER
jgi:predicted HicB family RNase H-like nuclease